MLETLRGTLPSIEPLHLDPSAYALVLLGTPVWVGRAAGPMRRFLDGAANSLPPAAYFCTYDGSGFDTAFQDMARRHGTRPLATLAVRRRDMARARHADALGAFLTRIASARGGGSAPKAAEQRTQYPGR